MAFLRMLFAGLFRRSRVESELARELRFHVESRAADLERGGLSPADAERQARLEFGGFEGYKEGCRDASGFRPFDEIRADLRYALRTLRQNPGFTSMTVLSLALGIGVNLSIFVSLYYVVLHPLPYPQLDRIMAVSETRAKALSDRNPVAPADYLDWKRTSRSFESLAAYREWDANLTGIDRPDHIQAALASAEFFDALGMKPVRGRTFSEAECEPGKDAVAVVSYGFWQARLASREGAIGETLSLGGRKYTIIGVMPYEFNLPLSSELWAPLSFTEEEKVQRSVQQLQVLGRLKPGVSPAQAGAELSAIARDLEQRYPRTNEERGSLVTSFQDVMKTESSQFVLVLAAAAMFVLLLACTNVGSLQVARTMSRQREIGLRRALGAGLFRILRQLLAESLVLGMAGGALGLVLAAWDLRLSRSMIPVMVYRFVPGLRDMRINGETVVLGIGLAIAASVLCCIPAILQVTRQSQAADVSGVLKEGGRSTGGSPARARIRTALVVAQVALAFVLLVGAGLMVGTFQRMLNVKLGYDPNHVLTGEIALYGANYRAPHQVVRFYETLLQNVSRLPDVEQAAARGELGPAVSMSIEGRAEPRPEEPKPDIHAATPGYLGAMKIPLLRGRWISEQDGPDSPRAVVLSESVARHYWPGSNPVGQHVRLGPTDSPWLTVVGVAGDINDWFLGNPMPAAYVSYRQSPNVAMSLLVRTLHEAQSIAGALRLEAQAVDREQPVFNVHTLQQQMYEETSGIRNAARMMIVYAVIALVLAITGIYSVTSFFVAQRTREIGVRMSLGATRATIATMVLRQAGVMGGLGLLIGLPLAIMLTVGMSHALFNVVSLQPAIFILVMATLGTLAAIAGYIPAHRAARVDPVIALRHE